MTESPYLEGPVKIENPEGFIRRPYKFGYQSHYTLGSFPFPFFFSIFPFQKNQTKINEIIIIF